MDFIANQPKQVKEMLKAIGILNIDALFQDVPENLKLAPPQYDDGLSEYEGMCLMREIAAKNTFSKYKSYLGAGSYEHHVPAIVQAICSKSEFLTSYTPYQAESSQGMLQAIFEYQSAVCALTGMDVSNASMYEGASASAESMLMAMRIHKDRKKIVIAGSLHPHYKSVIKQFLKSHDMQIVEIPYLTDARLDEAAAYRLIDENTAAVQLSYPNFFGVVDEISPIFSHAKRVGALSVLSANPLMYGLYASAADLGADIAVGDMQPLGISLQFGGPYAGYLACTEECVRQLPGRIVGETIDVAGRRAFVLTLQAREQHIRREKATSNICTNQALSALASLICVLWYGPEGLKQLALTNYQRTAYLKERLIALPGIKSMGDAPSFNEFAVSWGRPAVDVLCHFRLHGIEAGIDLSQYDASLEGYLLIAVTETKSKKDLDRYLEVAKLLYHE